MNAVGGVNPWVVAIAVAVPTFMEVLDTTITNVSMNHMAGSLAASQEEITWVLTSYLIANGIVLPISGWLANALGRKRFFMLCIAGFTLASLACGLATSLTQLIIFRVLQGLAGGGLQPIQQAIVIDTFPPEKRGQAFALSGITLIVAPVLGPTLGGWITDSYSWHWIFLINVPVGILALLFVSQVVHDHDHAKAQGFGSIDYIGLGLIALGFGALQLVLDRGQHEDWFDSHFIIIMACTAASALVSACVWLWRQKNPIIDLHLFQDKSFALCCLIMFFIGFALYGSSAILPLMVQSQFGYDAMTAGMILSPGGIAVFFLMPIMGKLVSKVDPRKLIVCGLLACSLGMWWTSTISADADYTTIMWMRVAQMVGLPSLFIPVSMVAFATIAKERSSKASAVFSLSRNLGGSVGIAVVLAFFIRKEQVHQSYLVGHLVEGNYGYDMLVSSLRAVYHGMGAMTEGMVQGRIYKELLHQAAMLAYHDTFVMLSGLMVSGLCLAFFLPKVKAAKAEGMAH